MRHPILIALLTGFLQGVAASGTPETTEALADRWLTNAAPHPGLLGGAILDSNLFSHVRLESLDQRLQVGWTPGDPAPDPATITVHASTAAEDHWPARDWRARPLGRSGRIWQTDLPVEDLDVPIVYYLQSARPGRTNVSPMRVGFPRALGLTEPTRHFWPLLEGFEQTLDSWRILPGSAATSLQVSPLAKTGRAALRVSMAPSAGKVQVATTRVRGWQVLHEAATGLRLWVRTQGGPVRLRCFLRAQAFTPAESTTAWPDEVRVEQTWQKVDLPFDRLSGTHWRDVDLFALELVADSAQGCSLLADDLQFLGPWRLDPP